MSPEPQVDEPRQDESETSPAAAQRYELAPERIPWHRLDYREGALLARVDGQRSRRAVLAAAEMDEEQGGELFDSLVEQGLIRPVDQAAKG
jgi:hypothetical protein